MNVELLKKLCIAENNILHYQNVVENLESLEVKISPESVEIMHKFSHQHLNKHNEDNFLIEKDIQEPYMTTIFCIKKEAGLTTTGTGDFKFPNYISVQLSNTLVDAGYILRMALEKAKEKLQYFTDEFNTIMTDAESFTMGKYTEARELIRIYYKIKQRKVAPELNYKSHFSIKPPAGNPELYELLTKQEQEMLQSQMDNIMKQIEAL